MKFMIIAMLSLLMASCAISVDYKMPISRFHTAETSGKQLGGNVQAYYEGSTKVTLGKVVAPTIFNSPNLTSSDEAIDRSRGLGFGAALGIIERLDIYYSYHDDSPDMFGAKFQIIGDGFEKGSQGIKVSIAGGFGSSKEEDALSSTSGGETRTFNSDLKVTGYEFLPSIGYRFTDKILLYFTGFFAEYDVEADLTSDTFDNIRIESYSKNMGGNLGVQLTPRIGDKPQYFAILEGGYGEAKYKGLESEDYVVYGFSLGGSF